MVVIFIPLVLHCTKIELQVNANIKYFSRSFNALL